ncbi:MAG: 50S ribosomal protein L32 [bacterium]|nr:50S ribosomal protein L32 [bacterium]
MGGVPIKHHSKSKVGRRRSQQALARVTPAVCLKCKGPTLAHKACPNCGTYTKTPRKQKSEARNPKS